MKKNYRLSLFFKNPDDFDPSNDHIDFSFINKLDYIMPILSLYFRPAVHGIQNIPSNGPALLVGNHGILGLDAFMIFYKLYKLTGRMPRGLGDYHLFMDPISNTFWSKVGALPGIDEIAAKYLNNGNLVNVYPGGARDAFKGRDGRYKLHWEKSTGFIKLAMKTNVPIILHMGIGSDDIYNIIGRIPLTGRIFLGNSKYNLPLVFGLGLLPKPVKLTYYISEPILLHGDADDPDVINKNHKMIWNLANTMLANGLQKRTSMWF